MEKILVIIVLILLFGLVISAYRQGFDNGVRQEVFRKAGERSKVCVSKDFLETRKAKDTSIVQVDNDMRCPEGYVWQINNVYGQTYYIDPIILEPGS